MSKLIIALVSTSLALLICGQAYGKARPRYKQHNPHGVLDSRVSYSSETPRQKYSRPRGHVHQLGAAASPGTQVGTTYYDYQHNTSTGRQVDEFGGRIQVSWMNAPGPSPTIRTVNWNWIDIVGSASTVTLDNGDTLRVYPVGPPGIPNGLPFAAVRPGFTNLRLTPTGRAAVGFHDSPEPGGVTFWGAHVDLAAGAGVFGGQQQAPQEPCACLPLSPIFPKFAISTCGASETIHHAIGTTTNSWSTETAPYGAMEVWYWRGVVSGQTIDWSGMPSGVPIMIDSNAAGLGAIIEAHDEHVTIAMLKQVGSFNSVNVDLVSYVSTDCGVTWPTLNSGFTNHTNYTDADPDGGYADVSAAYDDAGDIHIAWNTIPASEFVNSTKLYHWSQASGIRLVTTADWISSCEGGAVGARSNNGGGTNNAAISDVELAIKPAGDGPGAGIADELIYAIWTQYGPSDTDCAAIDGALGDSLTGYHNGEIYCSVSSNGGITWDRPTNLTGTETPDCGPGDCLSESWVTAAATADSAVYISYVLDLHAGGAVVEEGQWTKNPYMVMAVETREPVLEPIIAVSPQNYIELNADPAGGPETVDLNIMSVGNADLNYLVTVMADNGGMSHVLINGGASAAGTILAGGAPDVITVQYDCIKLGDPEELAWRLEVTSNDPENDPGAGGSPIDVNLQVFSASTWYTCDEDTLSTGLNVMQVSSCLEMGDVGAFGRGFFNAATQEEWMYSGSPLITRVTPGGDTVAYHNALMGPADRTRTRNKSYRAQSDLIITRDSSVTVGDSTYGADVAQGLWSTTDTTIGGTYEIVFPKRPDLNNGAYWKFTMNSLTGGPIDNVSYGVIADLDLDDVFNGRGSANENAGIAYEPLSYIGGQSGVLDTSGFIFTPYNTYMAVFYLPLGSIICGNDLGDAGQVLSNAAYAVPAYSTDSLYMLSQLFGAIQSWGSNIYDTVIAADDISVIMIDDYNRDLGATDTIAWGYGLAISDVSVADLESNIAAIRAVAAPCEYGCLINITGDVNESGAITSADIIFMVGFVFKGGPPPQPCAANGDVNCSGSVNSADVIYLVGHVFKGGPPPCDICHDPGAIVCIP